jgi:hypothetical protein
MGEVHGSEFAILDCGGYAAVVLSRPLAPARSQLTSRSLQNDQRELKHRPYRLPAFNESPLFASQCREILHYCDKLVEIDRLGYMHLKTGPQRTRPIFTPRQRRQRHPGTARPPGVARSRLMSS